MQLLSIKRKSVFNCYSKRNKFITLVKSSHLTILHKSSQPQKYTMDNIFDYTTHTFFAQISFCTLLVRLLVLDYYLNIPVWHTNPIINY